ncbi:MAG: RNA polymerase factor sigma-54 [Pseudomonadota bacterium]
MIQIPVAAFLFHTVLSNMKQSLQLKTSQQLRLSPQLQQAIRFLQLSTVDLKKEIQEAVDNNPLLEIEPFDDSSSQTAQTDASNEPSIPEQLSTEPIDFDTEHYAPDNASKFDDYVNKPVSTQHTNLDWGEHYERQNTSETLQESLRWQLNLTHITDRDKLIGAYIIDAILDNGRLSQSPEFIFESILLNEHVDDDPFDFDEFEVVRHLIQQLHPIGCGCNSLVETLSVQIQTQSLHVEVINAIHSLITKHLDLLGSHDMRKISRMSHIPEPYLTQAIDIIRSLNPYPGELIGQQSSQHYIIPDLVMHREKEQWIIRLNSENKLQLQLNEHYINILSDSKTEQSKAYLKEYLLNAKTLIKSLDTRNQTLLNVGSCIINIQQGFFTHGASAMVALTQKQLADDLDLHESTISRVTTQKYILTPRGVFELKYFFSSQLGNEAHGHSAIAVQNMIKEMIKSEPPEKPLSDSKIAKRLLKERGVDIARRTVAKYREILSIPTYNERKRIFK